MVLIDTHILLWIFSDSGRLTPVARDAILLTRCTDSSLRSE